MNFREAHKIWIAQCEAAETVRARFGLKAAFNYIVGEKLINFVEAASDNRAFAQELPRLLTGARQSLAKAAFPAAGRQDGNSGKAQRTLLPIHSGAKYEDHNTRRSAHPSSLPAANRMLAEDRVSVNESQCDSTRMPCSPENIWFRPL
jgi:hypothetical protein